MGSDWFLWESSTPLDDFGKMALALLLGGLIGLERKRHAHAAGMRTQMLVSSASCLLMLISMYIARDHKGDPGRIASQVVTGIGFLGAGAILRYGLTIRGLTTAASIWSSAAIGMAVGAGYLVGALGLTVLVVMALLLFDPLESWLTGDWEIKRIKIVASDVPDLAGRVETMMGQFMIHIRELGLKRDLKEKTLELNVTVTCMRDTNFSKLMQVISQIDGVTQVQIE